MMKNNIVKRISISTILLIVALTIAYGIYLKSQPTNEVDHIDTHEEKQTEIKVEDIENKATFDVPDVEATELEKEKQNEYKEEEIIVEVEKPIVPPKPEPPREEQPKEEPSSKLANTDTKPIPKDKDVVTEGDEQENPNPPIYEEQPKVEEKPIENPVVVTPNVPEDRTEDKGEKLVPDSNNPFLKPPSEVPTNGDGGEIKSDEYSDYVPNTGDKF
jgi:hypothetical protein